LPFQIEGLIVTLEREHPSWGAPKIREKLRRLQPGIRLPAVSTVHAVLDRHDPVTRGRKARYRAQGTALSQPTRPNELWCADYKGEFMLEDQRYRYPLTITDSASRSAFSGLSKLSVWWLRLGIGIERITASLSRTAVTSACI
jgi:putative transposase